MPAAQQVDWEAVEARLPIDQRPESRDIRKGIFKTMDSSNNGLLTLTEVQAGLSGVMGKDLIPNFDFRPAIKCAFECARDLTVSTKKPARRGATDCNIDIKEFHALLVAFRKYCELAVLFKTLDKSGDMRLSFKEVEPSISLLEQWGFTKKQVKAKFPDDWTESLTFDKFAEWIIAQFYGGMDVKLDDDENEDVQYEAAADELRKTGGVEVGTGSMSVSAKELQDARNARIVREEFMKYDTNGDGNISVEELSAVLKAINPKYTDDKIALLFRSADVNTDGVIDHEEFTNWLFGTKKK